MIVPKLRLTFYFMPLNFGACHITNYENWKMEALRLHQCHVHAKLSSDISACPAHIGLRKHTHYVYC